MGEAPPRAVDYFLGLVNPFQSPPAATEHDAATGVSHAELNASGSSGIGTVECRDGFWVRISNRGGGCGWEYSSRWQVTQFGRVRPIPVTSPAEVRKLVEDDLMRVRGGTPVPGAVAKDGEKNSPGRADTSAA